MILADLSTDRLIDENQLAAMNPARLDDCAALAGAVIRQRVKDLIAIQRGTSSAQWFSQRGIAMDCARWLITAGCASGDPRTVADIILDVVREKVAAQDAQLIK